VLNQLKTIVLLGVLGALVVGLGTAFAPGHVYLFVALAVAMNLAAYFFSDRAVLAMHGARELAYADAPALHDMTAELAARAGLPKPRLFLIPDGQPNAFATGRSPERGVVAVTAGLVERLTPRELRGVIAHELAHIRNRDILVATVAATLAAAVTYAANALGWLMLLGGRSADDESPAGGLAMVLVAPLAALLVQMGVSRSREYLADETGARISGDPEGLAQALQRLASTAAHAPAALEPATASLFIVNPLAGGEGIARWFSTHPPMAQRVRRLLALAGYAVPPSLRLRRVA